MECFVQHAVDYKGTPADRTETGGSLSATLIAGIELSERFSTLGVCVNLVPYLIGTLHLSSPISANIVSNFMGTSFVLSPLGGILADSYLGRYKTVLIFALIQGLGTSLLSISVALPRLWPHPCDPNSPESCAQTSTLQIATMYISLYFMAIGSGGLIPNVSRLCTDQYDEKNDENEKAELKLFSKWFFFLFTLGTLSAVTLLVYIEDEVSRSWAYGWCSLSMVIAILMFLSGSRTYRYKRLTKSPVVPILQVLVAAVKKRKYDVPENIEQLYEDNPDSSRIPHSNQFKFLDKAAIPTKDAFKSSNNSLVPNPWKVSSVTMVEKVKMMVKLLPIWATTIPFWTAFSQLMTFSVEQASTMNRSIGSFNIPAASLTIFFVLPTLITLALYNPLIKPVWRKLTGNPGSTNLLDIGMGLFLAAIGMAAAALAEVKRLSVVRASDPTRTSSSSSPPLPITVFLLIPQFALVGSGVAFMFNGQLDLFVSSQSRNEGMKTISTGAFLASLGLGFFFSSILVSLVQRISRIRGGAGWIGDSINVGRLDWFYGLLAILIAADYGVFLLCALRFNPSREGVTESTASVEGKGKEVRTSAIV